MLRFPLSLALVLSSCTAVPSRAAPASRPARSSSPLDVLVGGALAEGGAMATLVDLTDRIGPRLSGTPGAAQAVAWGVERLRAVGLSVRAEPAKVPSWTRGEERGEVLPGPNRRAWPLALTALGGSPGTPAGGVEAEVVEVTSLASLEQVPVKGRIVYFHHAMSDAAGYGAASELRSRGPAVAARLGAVATLVRSAASASFRSPHTGVVVFEPGAPTVPAAAIATEDADALHRWIHAGPVRVRLVLGCRPGPEVESANVVAELKGRERPDEVVLLGAHLDSWDLAVGAQDDGTGVAMVLEAARLMASLDVRPRRTVRFVLFMNEENGSGGAAAYAAAHATETHVAAFESDSGGGAPQAVEVHAGTGGEAFLAPLVAPLRGLGVAAEVRSGDRHGADLGALARRRGLATVAVRQDTTHYFDVHHSAADTLDKVDPAALARVTAAYAWLVWSVADAPGSLTPPAPETAP